MESPAGCTSLVQPLDVSDYQVQLPVTNSEMDTSDTSASDSNSDEPTTSSRSVRFGTEIMG